MPTINDYKKKALNDAGYSGDISTAEWKWLKAVCSPYVGAIPDMWRYALRQVGFTGNDLPDMQNKMFASLGLTGAFPNKWYKYWRDTPLDGVSWWPAGSKLAFEFDNGLGYNSRNLATTTPDSILTYTNPSAKMVYGSDGVLRYAPHNLLLQSQTFETASWTKGNCTVTANAAVAPDGTTTADALLDTAISDIHRVTQSFTAAAAGRTYTVSAYVKKSTLDYATIGITDISSGSLYAVAVFNLAAGTVATSGAEGTGYAVVSSPPPTSVGNGWYRCSVVVVAGTSASFLRAVVSTNKTGVITSASGGSEVYLGNGSGMFVWGAQVSIGSTLFTYIPTTTAAVYSLPIDHNPTTFEPLGVLIEEQRTNLLLRSQEFNDAAWAKTNATVSANVATAPDGTVTADSLIPSAGAGYHFTNQFATIGAADYTYSIYAKNAGYNNILLFNFTAARGINVNLTTGAVAGGTDITMATTYTVTDVGNGWWRISFVFTGTAALHDFRIYAANDASGDHQFTGDGTSGIYLWGAQLEAGAFATSYIPTVASQVTRAADQVSILTSAFAYNAAEGTMVVDYRAPLALAQDIVWIADGLAESLGLYTNGSSGVLLWCRDGGVTQVALTIQTMTGVTNKVAAAFKLNDFSGSLNGAAVAVDTVGTMPTPTSLLLAPRSISSANANIHIKRLTYFPTRRTNADLQVLTT